jgi:hypothetical protein
MVCPALRLDSLHHLGQLALRAQLGAARAGRPAPQTSAYQTNGANDSSRTVGHGHGTGTFTGMRERSQFRDTP